MPTENLLRTVGEAASLFRFSITFFIALAGLLAGAQDQLAKLDVVPGIITVFLLGFGADSIKTYWPSPRKPRPACNHLLRQYSRRCPHKVASSPNLGMYFRCRNGETPSTKRCRKLGKT